MTPARKIILYSLLALAIVVFLSGLFYYYTKYKKTFTDPIQAIPISSIAFFEMQDPVNTYDHLENGNRLWDALKGIQQFQLFTEQIADLDTILRQYDDIKELLNNGKLYISIHLLKGQNAHALLIFSLDPAISSYRIQDFISASCPENCHNRDSKYNHADIEYLYQDTTVLFAYSLFKGLFIGSRSDTLVKLALDQIISGESVYSASFERVRQTAGKKVDANIYLRHDHFNKFILRAVSDQYQEAVSGLSNLGQWLETDLIIKDDELLLNGYTDALDSTTQYLNVFVHQQPQEIGIPRILPYNTNFILSLGFESFREYFFKYREYLAAHGLGERQNEIIEAINREFNTDFVGSTAQWIGNEIALAATGYQGTDQEVYTLIQIRDKDKANEALNRFSARDHIIYKDYLIKRVIGGHSIPGIFGRAFMEVKQDFLIQLDDYFVFGEDQMALEQFINIYLSGKTLKRNENYKDFTDNLSDNSNIFIYLNLRNSAEYITNYLSPAFRDLIKSNLNVFRNFEGLAAQFSFINDMYYTSIYAKYNPAYVQEDLSIWKTVLDSEIQGQPYFVKDHRTGTLKVIVFDTDNQMYMIDHNGEVNWKIPIGEAVLSKVYTVDYYKNGKIQYLFNTASYIYLIDLLGRAVDGYPIKLSPKATNGLSVFDYEGSRNYRLLLAQEDNRIYNYDIKGLPLRGWKKPMARETITRPVEHVRMRNKDFLIAADEKGQVMILNRRGEDRINLKDEHLQAKHSAFYPNMTNSAKGIILTTNQHGKLTYIQNSGGLDSTDFGEFSPDHYFLYEDFDNNGHKDFIYLDKNELVVYDRFKQIIMQHTFKNEISSSPVIIPVSDNRNIIGIVSDTNRKVYLFDDEGNLVSTPDLIGKTQILVGSLLNDGQLNLIVGSGKTLYNYYFQ